MACAHGLADTAQLRATFTHSGRRRSPRRRRHHAPTPLCHSHCKSVQQSQRRNNYCQKSRTGTTPRRLAHVHRPDQNAWKSQERSKVHFRASARQTRSAQGHAYGETLQFYVKNGHHRRRDARHARGGRSETGGRDADHRRTREPT